MKIKKSQLRRIIQEEQKKILNESNSTASARMWPSAGGMHTLSVNIESDLKHGLLPVGFETELDEVLNAFFSKHGFAYSWQRGR
tara:strand:- start:2055 stop:2306 length:252 start_codon:yes stop_codon:yes gene_type:complete